MKVVDNKNMSKPIIKTFWLIWSFEHQGWWKPKKFGYTTNILEAGRYSYQEAKNIVEKANYGCYNIPEEAMVPDYLGITKKIKN